MNNKCGTKRFKNVENQIESYLSLRYGDMVNVRRPWSANLSRDIILSSKATNAGTVGASQCQALTVSHIMPSRDDKYWRWHSSFLRASSMRLGRLVNIGR
jgi:hypothetical protein